MALKNQLEVINLSCGRGDRILFANFNYQFNCGDFIQIEGHNGIGKTTLLRTLAGLSRPLKGNILFNSHQITQQRESFNRQLLYLGHLSGVKPELTAWENLRFYQQTTSTVEDPELLWDILQKVGLLGREDIAVNRLSAGQQKRVALARLWLSKAAVWILDEPFNAIDKQGVRVLTRLFEQQAEKGGIVIITSHQDVPSEKLKKVYLENYKFNEEDDDI
ncbi:heme ABC exporter ATP-binding protein CcmA [Mergibacter septicus]|uniref:Heme ABC exporter ATP-binding protein CcmA n=1 Tax=Mergibacter septicus TaxID=221402 RepID=A0A8D4IZJ1_9PAST|nr:cytochrome c biogenesis heme-transporting ATPase CcmA [Mergibacter septicus]AWX13155.1 heme ABC exporter ATP-binding protein CcmA [Mergibacter septicus]AWX15057.1 heme ABC exporter ATP-binding protein CcmA [Mergibacter septicus]QDJ14310.1 heme ABC exporter ATP-binding protein CcmA [Mergibacter septicus]UTU48249.1 cytochrome c biogenesis heme-transporting ATPase CcmA [Mergibacter septicus]WMR96133.1 cytochrome c biogenesis heme-transporting ATPase CcmA [Mergibacter septicus]